VELVLEKLNLGFAGVKAVFVSEAHLRSFLALDVSPHRGCARRADPVSVIAATPKGEQARARRDELGSQEVRGRALQAIDHSCHHRVGSAFYKPVYVIWHNLQAVNRYLQIFGL
jgi:hypothetical protein